MLMDRNSTSIPNFPVTRATALRRWKAAVVSISVVQIAVFLVLSALRHYRSIMDSGASSRVGLLTNAIGLPLLFLAIAYFAERRLLRRPPKPLLLSQFTLFALGTAVETVCLLRLQAGAIPSELLVSFGHAALALALISVGGWFAGVLLLFPLSSDA